MQTSESGPHLLLMADILQKLVTNLIPTVSGGAYQDIRKVTTEWNDACNIGTHLNSEAESTRT